jgi:hypothetical protein
MGYQPIRVPNRNLDNILGKERGRIFSELAITLWHVANVGFSMSEVADSFASLMPMPNRVDSLTITNDQGMEFPLAYEENDR